MLNDRKNVIVNPYKIPSKESSLSSANNIYSNKKIKEVKKPKQPSLVQKHAPLTAPKAIKDKLEKINKNPKNPIFNSSKVTTNSIIIPESSNFDTAQFSGSIKRYIIQSDFWNIKTNKELKVYGWENSRFNAIVNDINVFFDCSDLPNVLNLSLDQTTITNPIYNEVSFVFVLQYRYSQLATYKKLEAKYGFTILPWVYIPLHNFKISKFIWKNTKHKYIANMAFGLSRWHGQRKPWVRAVYDNHLFYKNHHSLNKNDYYEVLQETEWGLNLKGCIRKGENLAMDGKCHRESEYLSLGMPMAYSYMPCYPFSFVPDQDYLFLHNPSDLLTLHDNDAVKFHERSLYNWENYFSPKASMELLYKLIYDKNYREKLPTYWKHFEERKQEYLKT